MAVMLTHDPAANASRVYMFGHNVVPTWQISVLRNKKIKREKERSGYQEKVSNKLVRFGSERIRTTAALIEQL
ncbi:hypothetical protein E1301_Tti021161 [Triplophysa tibetana]|uniref:Uncharacterized protein n=1 Tax=Triplophysa tibetana TaxID=1572043 RepID=A0A5A9P117_9TELE|nr:hypothetical protein E1301_Tti021161 [Triplophysa tibetana]